MSVTIRPRSVVAPGGELGESDPVVRPVGVVVGAHTGDQGVVGNPLQVGVGLLRGPIGQLNVQDLPQRVTLRGSVIRLVHRLQDDVGVDLRPCDGQRHQGNEGYPGSQCVRELQSILLLWD